MVFHVPQHWVGCQHRRACHIRYMHHVSATHPKQNGEKPHVHIQRPRREEERVSFGLGAYVGQAFEVEKFACAMPSTQASCNSIAMDKNVPMGIPHNLRVKQLSVRSAEDGTSSSRTDIEQAYPRRV